MNSDEFYSFIEQAYNDPDLLDDRFPGYVRIFRLMGIVSLIIFMVQYVDYFQFI